MVGGDHPSTPEQSPLRLEGDALLVGGGGGGVGTIVVVVVVVRRRLHRARARHNVQADGTRQHPIAVLLHPRSQPHERLALLALLGEGSFTGGSVTRRQRKLQLHLANLALAPLDGAPRQASPLAAVSEPTQAPRRPERIGGGLGRRERAPKQQRPRARDASVGVARRQRLGCLGVLS